MEGGFGRRRPRWLLPAALAIAAALLWPASSHAFVACNWSGGQLSANLTADDDSVTFQRFGSQIAVLTGSSLSDDGYDDSGETQILIPCSGEAATVDNTDRVSVVQSPGADFGRVTIDQSAGSLGPGATPEADGTSEIEFSLNLPGRVSEVLVGGTEGSEAATMGTLPSGGAGVNTNAQASDDPEIEVAGARVIAVDAKGGNDLVTALGGAGFTGPLHGVIGSAQGGTGNDLLIAGPDGSDLDGDEGSDRLLGSPHKDFLEGGSGRDTILAGKGSDRIESLDRKRDRIRCGPGKRDRVFADAKDAIKGCERGVRIRFRRHHRPQVFPLAPNHAGPFA